MGALPKNKITRVEQGKRRRGNAPKLKKDANSQTPLHKRGFVAQFLKFIGGGSTEKAPKSAEAKSKTKTSSSAQQVVASEKRAANRATKAAPKQGPAGATRKTPVQKGK